MKIERFVIDPRTAPTIVGRTVYTKNAVTNDLDSHKQNQREENLKKNREKEDEILESLNSENELNGDSDRIHPLDILA